MARRDLPKLIVQFRARVQNHTASAREQGRQELVQELEVARAELACILNQHVGEDDEAQGEPARNATFSSLPNGLVTSPVAKESASTDVRSDANCISASTALTHCAQPASRSKLTTSNAQAS
eukprot:CAMPEP_0177532032 /NCGR_PEP_ID=MMETSP0369-20130122/54400_1 /TAXON_ID=447022 ORGANISM="Scrippsiella hangoei-like, Strain SHHI-4" /NCGR_SAMPLE_ID=MMETSP0369 /ASSEMBLY_ACC=CAM_ASM_000364 /LENGTH=121 /DNA_ID=CAMNT_0019013295 /DNA_START=44 /DNA_END=407 /DNA_ORIENTATION=+